ncbi:hypothetical protein FB45DRAFT_1026299 [Roridomyces roridus]|uniref:Uncharacterized protein n=1 Tax=Roridomyces roridus TaxID=1738132 RepID=A0AAD7FP98_9AGAR|nr:hypothetical protein FB45DRAFT_1026299 [Roridomyces roridus]
MFPSLSLASTTAASPLIVRQLHQVLFNAFDAWPFCRFNLDSVKTVTIKL